MAWNCLPKRGIEDALKGLAEVFDATVALYVAREVAVIGRPADEKVRVCKQYELLEAGAIVLGLAAPARDSSAPAFADLSIIFEVLIGSQKSLEEALNYPIESEKSQIDARSLVFNIEGMQGPTEAVRKKQTWRYS